MWKTTTWRALLAMALVTAVLPAAQDKKRKVCVIVHAANPAEKLSKEMIRQLYLKKEHTWERAVGKSAGAFRRQKVVPVEFQGDVEARDAFFRDVLSMNADSVARYWIKLQYQSAIKPAKQLTDAQRVIRFVGAMKGGIGFVPADELDAAARKKVKVLLEIDV